MNIKSVCGKRIHRTHTYTHTHSKINTETAFPKIFITIAWCQIKLWPHIISLKQTTTYHVYNLNKLQPYINKNTVTLLTHSQILSRLNYCNILLTVQTKTTLKIIYVIINRSIGLIYKLKQYDYITSITDLRLGLNWMITANFIDYKLLTIFKKNPDK